MNSKKIFTVALLLFVASSVGYMIVNEKKPKTLVSEERVCFTLLQIRLQKLRKYCIWLTPATP